MLEAEMPDMFYPTLLGRWLAEDGTVGISPGELDWLECCSSSRSTSTAGEATQEDVFRHPFIARRMQDGRLDPETAAELWNYHVGYHFNAGEDSFYTLRHAIIRHGGPSEADKEVAASRRVLALAASRRVLTLDSGPGGRGEYDDSGDGESEHDDTGGESVDGNEEELRLCRDDWLKCSSPTSALPGERGDRATLEDVLRLPLLFTL